MKKDRDSSEASVILRNNEVLKCHFLFYVAVK